MLFHHVLLSCLLTCVITQQADGREFREDLDDVFPSWSSVHHVSKVTHEKRQADVAPLKDGQIETTPLHVKQVETKGSEGDAERTIQEASEVNVESKPQSTKRPEAAQSNLNNTSIAVSTPSIVPGNVSQSYNVTVSSSTTIPTTVTSSSDSTAPKAPSFQPDLSNPGVVKRGLIVFGAFALMAVAYFIFYRRKNKNNDSNNTHGSSDTNQFRYGVLQSDDRRDNLELSRIPLTMESDEDEDEDLEIFDLEQKKKSLSYVNLQMSDDYIVNESGENARDRDSLLLDIEDANSDTLINWSSNGNKSIL